MAYLTKRLSVEDRNYYEKRAKVAVPYTEEEADSIMLDDPRMEIKSEIERYGAYFALKVLAEDDALKAAEQREAEARRRKKLRADGRRS